ncbi:MAG: hypothetical protein E6Q38_03685 [Crocinitomicaceae bacterium]|nr:MAG: hypothetical protein E6Q38_03685 [Crocinitomicaceae bacterium]
MQNYKNHLRLNPAHHFVLTPLATIIFVWSIILAFDCSVALSYRIITVIATTSLLMTAFIARVYAIKNQDRIIRLEMRQRYFEMTGTSFSAKEKQLKLSQIIALRFASDEELLSLMERAIAEKLSSKEIKLAITDWQADYHRV